METVLAVLGVALCVGCMAMMGGMALGGLRRLVRHRDDR
jgi:hypothetical protein